jgi:hypothetical protein
VIEFITDLYSYVRPHASWQVQFCKNVSYMLVYFWLLMPLLPYFRRHRLTRPTTPTF